MTAIFTRTVTHSADSYARWTATTLIVVFALTTTSIFGQTRQKNTLSAMNLKGSVKAMKVTEYNVSEEILNIFGKIQPSTTSMSESYIFDSIGNTVEYNSYYGSGGLIFTCIYKHDSIRRPIEINSVDEKKRLINKNTLKCDTNGNVTEENIFSPDGNLREKWSYKYDENGNVIEENNFDSKERRVKNLKLKYDSKENVVEGNSYARNGNLLSTYTCRYDGKSNIIEKIFSEPNNSATNKFGYTYTFDNNGNWIERIIYRMDLSLAVHKNDVPISITKREIEYF